MKKLISLVIFLILFFNLSYAKDVQVKGYFKKDGTYIAPHHRSFPDNTVINNYDYQGNINPYTGETGNNHYKNNPSSVYYQPSYQPQKQQPERIDKSYRPSYDYDDSKSKSSNYLLPSITQDSTRSSYGNSNDENDE